MKNKKTVLIILNTLERGGVCKTLLDFCEVIDDEKYDVTLLLSNRLENGIDKKLKKGIKTIFFEDYTRIKNIKHFLAFGRLARNKVLKQSFDIEILYSFAGFMNYFGVLKGKFNYSILHEDFAMIRNYDKNVAKKTLKKKVYNIIMNIFLSKIDKLLIVSKGAQTSFVKLWGNAEKTAVFSNCVNCEKLLKLSNNEIELPKNSYFINVSRQDSYKNVLDVVKAYEQILQQTQQYKLLLCGNGNQHQEIVDYVTTHKMQDYVVYKDYIDNPYPYFANAKLFLNASKFESFGLTLLEAYVFGVPVVALKNNGFLSIHENCQYFCEDIYEMKEKCLIALEKIDENYVDEIKNIARLYDQSVYKQQVEKLLSGGFLDEKDTM